MRLLFLFLDGVGLGKDDPATNPLAGASMPNLQSLLGGKRLLLPDQPGLETPHASLLALDANLGVSGLPQSASGQATLLTGINIPARLGYHYGPKPNPPIAEFLRNGNVFNALRKGGRSVALLNAYPPRYFAAIASGYRIYSAIPLAAVSAGLSLKTAADLSLGTALAADFTAQGWREHLGLTDTPLLSPVKAGRRLATLASGYDLAFFEYWLSDYAGHRQDMLSACSLLETLDGVIGGLLEAWDEASGLILLTSDHGNLEDLSTRRHTHNPVPLLLIGAPHLRQTFLHNLWHSARTRPISQDPTPDPPHPQQPWPGQIQPDLSDIAPAMLSYLGL